MNILQQFSDYTHLYPECHTCEHTLKVLNVRVQHIQQNELEFDIIGMKPFIVNALRQTILNDVPTMAIEDVYFYKNSSICNCDYISQRLALVPIKADPNDFKFVNNSEISNLNSDNTIVLNLNVVNNENKPIKVYSKSLIWEPFGKQTNISHIEPLFPNIPLLHLKSDEEISCRIFCIKGLGRNHMKFCPGIAKYCFLSKIDINKDKLLPEMAHKLKESFPPGVIELKTTFNGKSVPYVANARLDRLSRSFKNDPEVCENISVKYYRDYIIFNVESYGVIPPVKIVVNAFDILIYKYNTWKERIEQFRNTK